MKKILIILLLYISYQTVFANEACKYVDRVTSKELNDKVYGIITKSYEVIQNDIDKLIYINTVYNRVSHLKHTYTSDISNCTISGILYRLQGNKSSLLKSLENIDQKQLESAPIEIQSLIEASKNSTF